MVEIAKRAAVDPLESGDPKESDGFRARLSKASLPDLVQMECLAKSEASFRVISEGRVGYLFFLRGQLAHAFVDDLSGEEAALEILGWQRGTFEPCQVVCPESAPILCGWQQLIMRSAQRRDETQRRDEMQRRDETQRRDEIQRREETRRPPLAAVPSRPPPYVTAPSPARALVPPSKPIPARPVLAQRSVDLLEDSAPSVAEAAAPSHEFVRLDANGEFVSGRGDVETLAQVASYSTRLANLVGDALGMSRFVALEAAVENERKIIHVDSQGGTLALVAAAAANLANVRKKLDL
jgi:Domain of unknown function (DUF4388)